MVDELNSENGRTIGNDKLSEIIQTTQENRIQKSGCIPLTSLKHPSQTTLNNSKAVISSQSSISITTSAIQKTNNRFTAENSLISSMSFILVIASTHYMTTYDEQQETRQDMKDAPIDVKMLYSMVSTAYNDIPIFPIKPQYILSTDDSVVYTYQGKGRREEKFMLVATKGITKSRTRAMYKHDDSNEIH